MNFDDDVEEDLPTAPLMTQYGLRNLYWTETYAFIWVWENQWQVTFSNTHPTQEPIYESIIQDEPMDSMESGISNLINIPKEVFFQNYLYPSWIELVQMMLAKEYDTLPNTNNYNAFTLSIILLTSRH